MRVVFAGGGTGGHIFPGLAVASSLAALSEEVEYEFWGDGRPLETTLLEAQGAEHRILPCAPLPRNPFAIPRFVYRSLAGYTRAKRLLKSLEVSAVVGLGGYSSWAPVTAGRRLGLPTLLLEQNAVPGRANVHLARRASLVCPAWQETADLLPSGARVEVTGNPVRGEIVRAAKSGAHNHAGDILVLGGSSGAVGLNSLVISAGPRLASLGRRIVHQTGGKDFERVAESCKSVADGSVVQPFIGDMPSVYSSASIVIARAGGTTLSEIALFGIPAVLVPYPHHRDRHQYANASIFARAGAAVIIEQTASGGRLADAVEEILGSTSMLETMHAAALSLGRPQAADAVAGRILELARQWPRCGH
ncbi:MAG: UDP-N-acetylglucosamine--N-acetylmuramyl-(pentapeptide) pyrophosphoryl-undecaprenol N-acetylglucosamine transferase [Planctomycetota bacterium]|jgi:UDP-N-acetylglucosamine--N-acetylmuramyl-(pentapeptide) pyrophosphoryl-undecaprenol N-acetylglucosamine transferase